jgi:hypothetical protein
LHDNGRLAVLTTAYARADEDASAQAPYCCSGLSELFASTC